MPNKDAANPNTANSRVTVRARDTTEFGQILREIVITVISLAIVFLALWFLWDVYGEAKKVHEGAKLDTYHRQKDVLLLALGLLGTVTGYYFGRVPAERHADAARGAAKTAQEREQKVRQQVHAGLEHIQQQHNASRGGAAAATDPVNTAIDQLRSNL